MKLIGMNVVGFVVSGLVFLAPLHASETVGSAHITKANADKTVTYQNQRGSVLTLTWHESHESKGAKSGDVVKEIGSLTGTFTTAVGKCAAGTTIPVSGYFSGNAVAITFNYPQCKQVVAMTGNLTNGNDELHTLWLDAAQSADPMKSDWNTNITGADHYKKKR